MTWSHRAYFLVYSCKDTNIQFSAARSIVSAFAGRYLARFQVWTPKKTRYLIQTFLFKHWWSPCWNLVQPFWFYLIGASCPNFNQTTCSPWTPQTKSTWKRVWSRYKGWEKCIYCIIKRNNYTILKVHGEFEAELPFGNPSNQFWAM